MKAVRWSWLWIIGKESQAPVLEETSRGMTVTWRIGHDGWDLAFASFLEMRANVKRRPRMDQNLVRLEDLVPADGFRFRNLLSSVVNWIGEDRGLVVLGDVGGRPWIPIEDWSAWSNRRGCEALAGLPFLEALEERRRLRTLDQWLHAFVQEPRTLGGWIAGFAPQSGVAPEVEALPPPTAQARRDRQQHFASLACWVLCALVLIAGIVGARRHLAQSGATPPAGATAALEEEGSDVVTGLASAVKRHARAMDSLAESERRLPPGFGLESQREVLARDWAAWLGAWRPRFLAAQAAEVKACVAGQGMATCELEVEARVLAWSWVAGRYHGKPARLEKAWKVMMGSDELEWNGDMVAWLATQAWAPLALESDAALLEQWRLQANKLERTWVGFVRDRVDSVELSPAELGLPAVSPAAVRVPRLLLAESQASVEDYFALAMDDSALVRFVKRLKERQWQDWQGVLATWLSQGEVLGPGQADTLRRALITLASNLGLDSVRNLDSVAESVSRANRLRGIEQRAHAVRDSLQNFMSLPWLQTWPLRCRTELPDIDLAELARTLGKGGELDQWLQRHEVELLKPALDSQSLRHLRQLDSLRNSLLDSSGHLRARRLRFESQAPEHWRATLTLDSLVVAAGSGGVVEWPAHPVRVALQAQDGDVRFQWSAEGPFALLRLFAAFGQWREGRGLELSIPLRTPQYRDQWTMHWTDDGPEPRFVKPCGLAWPRIQER